MSRGGILGFDPSCVAEPVMSQLLELPQASLLIYTDQCTGNASGCVPDVTHLHLVMLCVGAAETRKDPIPEARI